MLSKNIFKINFAIWILVVITNGLVYLLAPEALTASNWSSAPMPLIIAMFILMPLGIIFGLMGCAAVIGMLIRERRLDIEALVFSLALLVVLFIIPLARNLLQDI